MGELTGTKTANRFMLFLLTFNVLWQITFGAWVSSIVPMPWFLIAVQLIGLILPLGIFIAISPRNKKKFDYHPLGLINILLICVLSLLFQPVMMLFSAVASLFMPNPVTGLMGNLAEFPFLISLTIVAVTPAICEEVVFRGYIQSKYEGQPMLIIALVNGLFFGIIHMNLHQLPYAFVMGVVFAYMVYFTRNIVSAVLSHFIINASQFTLGYMAVQYIYNYGAVYEDAADADLIAAIAAIGQLMFFILPFLVLFIYLFVRHNKGRNSLPDTTSERPSLPFDWEFFAVIGVFITIVVVF